jgi:phosphoglycolate phosphatase-like HAD superfamily hydrolase
MLLRRLGQSARALSTRRRNATTSAAAMATTAATAQQQQQRPPDAAPASARRRTIRGCVFDMDGTLVFSEIDFKEMRRRIGAPAGTDILEHVASLPTERARAEALSAIAEVEHAAIAGMRLAPGALALARELDARRVPRALVTRNVLRSLHHFHSLHWIPGVAAAGPSSAAAAEEADSSTTPPFHPAITRECGLRHKPHPDALEHIAARWGVRADELVMIGDSAFDDVASGRRAGSVTVLIDAEGEYDHEWSVALEGRDEVADEEEAEEEEEEAQQEAGAPLRRGETKRRGGGGGGGGRGRYLAGERAPHHKVRCLEGVREVLFGAGSRYDWVGMDDEGWARRQADARAAAEAAHAAVAADGGGGGGAVASWQALE